ncbi:bifunctional diaminohydroxyphosphoribosylaminopyrimidine deaminase/5-amino-6-(5-phosphoribosylamino)uracil reductase RibD [Croceitalea sp. MTPC9]|nr:bifunctional diaminohydroxyphosphoribosylaminopyrimidine deaminase/5-amino-6-(5-phosphoribosylamino)uracil reductase RibD [Croceitalea sp. MTPC6]GMN15477.1 bifunctional diaminohydroxyphosphoribosylaminopyrimidine deaminase/5-amino-6-(5-phosphoribosylamino)uracil reductase RibD [Croceitalea sp. MTPC9]
MLRCIELGKNGLGTTAPNPMVGCVIVHNNKIVGEGFTSPYGGPHAEVNAINSVKQKSILQDSTLYVTLEPCFHYGKTPPCVNLILKYKISKVVIGLKDTNPKVAGKSIQLLKEAGRKVAVGVLEKECRAHHKRFLSFQEKKRPYIILKWAETLDGFIAPEKSMREKEPQPFWITNEKSKQLVHRWRSQEQAILVGTNTILKDNPKLNVRHWKGKNPIRIFIDKSLKTRSDYNVLDSSVKTIIITAIKDESKYIPGVDYDVTEFKDLPVEICGILHKHEITSVIIEGGTKTLQSFIDSRLWDEARIFAGTNTFDKGVKAPQISGKLLSERKIVNDKLTILKND